MDFGVVVSSGDEWQDLALVAGPQNRYVRTAIVVAFQMDTPFKITTEEGVLAEGGPGDYIVLDNGIPRVELFDNFRQIHTLMPPEHDDAIEQLQVVIERVIAKHVEFEDDQGAGELADAILGAIATIEVPL